MKLLLLKHSGCVWHSLWAYSSVLLCHRYLLPSQRPMTSHSMIMWKWFWAKFIKIDLWEFSCPARFHSAPCLTFFLYWDYFELFVCVCMWLNLSGDFRPANDNSDCLRPLFTLHITKPLSWDWLHLFYIIPIGWCSPMTSHIPACLHPTLHKQLCWCAETFLIWLYRVRPSSFSGTSLGKALSSSARFWSCYCSLF